MCAINAQPVCKVVKDLKTNDVIEDSINPFKNLQDISFVRKTLNDLAFLLFLRSLLGSQGA